MVNTRITTNTISAIILDELTKELKKRNISIQHSPFVYHSYGQVEEILSIVIHNNLLPFDGCRVTIGNLIIITNISSDVILKTINISKPINIIDELALMIETYFKHQRLLHIRSFPKRQYNMKTWVGSPTDIRQHEEAAKALETTNDIAYHNKELGTIKVDRDRWLAAQNFEETYWLKMASYAESDRNHEHANKFHEYETLKHDLGSVLEIGCGPFTQLVTILNHSKTYANITLQDPLINKYKTLEHCQYNGNKFYKEDVNLLPIMAEELDVENKFDTIICINVLEHVMDAMLILDNIHRALKPHGTIIMGERTHDNFQPHNNYDVGHPILIKTKVLSEFKSKFSLVFDEVYNNQEHYFIGNKKL